MTTVTRFAPSPTGFLHIGGARTALFNWLFARHADGKFVLRIEDTDKKRSTQEAIDAILSGLKWLGLDWDDEPIYQSKRQDRHAEVVKELLANGHAYECYCTEDELKAMRAEAESEGKVFKYDRRWREPSADMVKPDGVKPVIRLKAQIEGGTIIHDAIQGKITVPNSDLDDMIILRSDGSPTYMLAVVVDDHDMGVTNIIRGDDHLTNSFRQQQIYDAMGWSAPEFAHVPLIHGQDGAKLSKRHGALGVEAYRDMGFLPEALQNYLLRLGWSHGDDEIISQAQAIEWFTLKNVGKSPSRFDTKKLEHLNSHYIKEADNERLLALTKPFIEETLGKALDETHANYVLAGMDGLKSRAKTLLELRDKAMLYVAPQEMDDKAKEAIEGENKNLLGQAKELLEKAKDWSDEALMDSFRNHAESVGVKLGQFAAPVRVALTGTTASPSIFEMMSVFGKEETLARINRVL